MPSESDELPRCPQHLRSIKSLSLSLRACEPSYLSTTTSPNLNHPSSRWPLTCSKSLLSISLLFLLFLVAEHPMTVGAVDACDVVLTPLLPCLVPFSSPDGGYPPSSMCCSGAALVAEGNNRSPAGSMIVCLCLQALMTRFQLIRPQAARNTFAKCNVSVPVPEPTTNCLP